MSEAPAPRGELPSILHVIAGLDTGGIQVGLVNVIEHTAHLFRHSVCCIGRSGALAERLASRGVPVHFLPKAERHEWTMFLRVAALCRRLRPDIVHTRNWSTFDAIPGARLARVSALIHVDHTWELETGWKPVRRRFARRMLAPLVDRFLVVSEDVRQSMVRDIGIRAEEITLIPNGVDTEMFKPAPDRQRLRAERGYTEKEIVIGSVGRAVRVKNWSALLEAFARLHQGHPHLRLALVGDGPERAASQRQAQELGLADAVRFAAHIDQVREWLAIMDVFALPSRSEAASIALLEAMAMAVPVVATDVGGTSRILNDGVTGRLVRLGDIASLAETLLAYCEDEPLRRTHGCAGRSRVEEHFSLGRMAAEYTDVYRSMLRFRSPSARGCSQ